MLPALLQLHADKMLLFVLVLARVGAVVLAAPIFGAKVVPWHLRILLAVSLSVMVMPLQWHIGLEVPDGWLPLLLLAAAEALVGLALGMGVAIWLCGVELVGRLISQASGLGLAQVTDLETGAATPVHAQFLNVMALITFVAIGGHRILVAALLETFQALPPGGAAVPTGLADTTTLLLVESFRLGVRAAAPALTAVLAATLVVGLIGRALPQLNTAVFGLGISAFAGVVGLLLALGGVVFVFGDQLEPMLDMIVQRL